MIECIVPRTARAKAAVQRAKKIVSENSEMIDEMLVELPELKDRDEPQAIALEDYRFEEIGSVDLFHQKIRTTNKYVTFFRDMLSQ